MAFSERTTRFGPRDPWRIATPWHAHVRRALGGRFKESVDLASSSWSKDSILRVMNARYESVHYVEEDNFAEYYAIEHYDARFMAVLAQVGARPDRIGRIFLYALFAGPEVDHDILGDINAALQLAVCDRRNDGKVRLFCVIPATGALADEENLARVFNIWERDYSVTVLRLSEGVSSSSFMRAAPARALAATAPRPEDAAHLFGAADASAGDGAERGADRSKPGRRRR